MIKKVVTTALLWCSCIAAAQAMVDVNDKWSITITAFIDQNAVCAWEGKLKLEHKKNTDLLSGLVKLKRTLGNLCLPEFNVPIKGTLVGDDIELSFPYSDTDLSFFLIGKVDEALLEGTFTWPHNRRDDLHGTWTATRTTVRQLPRPEPKIEPKPEPVPALPPFGLALLIAGIVGLARFAGRAR